MKFTVRVAQVYHEVFNGIEADSSEAAVLKVEEMLMDGVVTGELIFEGSSGTESWKAYQECEGVQYGK